MARVTIEDSLENCENIYHLIMLASYRAHQLQHGVRPRIDPKQDSPTVLALREIAAGHMDFSDADDLEKDPYGRRVPKRLVEKVQSEEEK